MVNTETTAIGSRQHALLVALQFASRHGIPPVRAQTYAECWYDGARHHPGCCAADLAAFLTRRCNDRVRR